MKLVQIVQEVSAPPSAPLGDTPAGKCFEVVADFTTVQEALDAIAADTYGNGPFNVITVNRRGVKLQPVTEMVMDQGEVFGPEAKGAGRPPKPPAPTGGKDDKGKGGSKK